MFLWMLLGTAQATIWSVPGDFDSLALAVVSPVVVNGDTIEVDAIGFSRSGLDAVITKDLTIVGLNGRPTLPRLNIAFATVTVESATLMGSGAIFAELGLDLAVFASLSTVTLRDCDVFPDPNGGGAGLGELGIGVFGLGSVLNLDGVLVEGFAGDAPAVNLAGGAMDVVDSVFEGNLAGAIATTDAPLTVTTSDFFDNQGFVGGSILANNLGNPTTLIVSGSDFSGGGSNSGGAISAANAHVYIDTSSFTDGWAYDGGGAVAVAGYADDPVTFEVSDTSFTGNSADEAAGAIIAYNAHSTLTDVTFSDNTSGAAGAVLFGGGTMTIERGDFDNNVGFYGGGALFGLSDYYYDLGHTDLLISDSTIDCISDGPSGLDGGALLTLGDVSAILVGTDITNCSSDLSGGAIAHWGTSLTLEDCTLKSNSSWLGGAIDAYGGTVKIDQSRLSGNSSELGGAILTSSSNLILTDSLLVDNWSNSGGAVDGNALHGLTMSNNLVCGNSASGSGATVSLTAKLGEPYQVHNNVWMDNSTDLGAALLLDLADQADGAGPSVNVHNNDFLDNTVSSGVVLRNVAVDFRNNIVQGHPIGALLDGQLSTVTGDYNLFKDNGSHVEGGGGQAPGPNSLLDVDPGFQGYTPGLCDSNLYLTQDSPARDGGDPDILDADGTVSDIGAFGGPDSGLVDQDGDGWWSDLDCDDLDAEVGPCEDQPDPCDVDGDGFEDEACGGADCNDTDGTIFPGAPDKADDDIDSDCDGFEPQTWVNGGGGCACDQGPGSTPWWLAGALVLLARRRRIGG